MATDDTQLEISDELAAILDGFGDEDEMEVSDPFAADTSTTDEDATGAEDAPEEVSTEDVESTDEGEVDAEADASDETDADEGTDEDAEGTEDADAEEAEEEVETPSTASLTDEDLSKVTTVKINGQDREVKVEELIAGYRKAEAADERFREAAEVRKQAEQAVSFNEQFNTLWDPQGVSKEERLESRADLLGHFLELAGSPEQGGSPEDLYMTWAALTKRVAATGGFSLPGQPQEVAQRLGFDEATLAKTRAEHYEAKVARAQQAEAAQAEAASQETSTQEKLVADLQTVLADAEMQDAPLEAKKAYLTEVTTFATEKGIPDIHRAHAAYQRAQVKAESERQARAAAAVAKTPSKASKRAASLTSRPAASSAPGADTRTSEEKAYEAIFGRN